MSHEASKQTIETWLKELSATVKSRDLDAHMSMISPHIHVYGVPGHEFLDYDQWRMRRKNEFDKRMLAGLHYTLKSIKTQTLRRLIFNVEEIMSASNGQAVFLEKQMVLELSPDEKWQLVEETIDDWHIHKQ